MAAPTERTPPVAEKPTFDPRNPIDWITLVAAVAVLAALLVIGGAAVWRAAAWIAPG